MITRLLRSAVLAVVAVVMMGLPALARHDNDRDDDRDNDRVVIIRDTRPRNAIVVREVRSPRVIVVPDRFDDRPYGWSRGRKVGWGNCDLPPGLAKKYGCSNRNTIILRERPVYRQPLFFFSY